MPALLGVTRSTWQSGVLKQMHASHVWANGPRTQHLVTSLDAAHPR